jgi:ribosomal protein S18 acetylase RimI-like enzyme
MHMRAFPGFFLTSLGPRFLTCLYSNYLLSDRCICLVAEEQNTSNLTGFAFGVCDPKLFYPHLRRTQWYRFVLASIPGLIHNPYPVMRRLASALRYRGDATPDCKADVLLSSIAVDPAFSRSGQGKALIQNFCVVASTRGGHAVFLVTDRDQNEQVNRFYHRSGFLLDATFKRSDGRWMNRYVKHLSSEIRNNYGP